MTQAEIRLDGENLLTKFEDGKINTLPVNQIREIKDPVKRQAKMAEYIWLRGIENNKRLVHKLVMNNEAHRDLCLFEANILGVTASEVLLSCAMWAHHYDYAPHEEKEISI